MPNAARSCPDCGAPMSLRAARCRTCATVPGVRVRGSLGAAAGAISAKNPAADLDAARCAASPTGAHIWWIDSQNHGVCDHCGAEREFKSEGG